MIAGGVDGYYNVLRTPADPEDDDHEDMRTWVGEDWDPERFDPSNVQFDNPWQRTLRLLSCWPTNMALM